ncbi:MAG: lysophospholipid acyltransferase family protein [Pseudomonadota bacterium]
MNHETRNPNLTPEFFEIIKDCKHLLKEDPVLFARLFIEFLKKYILLPAEEFIDNFSMPNNFGIDEHLMEKIRPFFQFLFHDYFRVSVKGINNLPLKSGALIVSNHSGCLPYDAVMIHLGIYNHHKHKRLSRMLVDDFAYRIPLLRKVLDHVGAVKASPENAKRLISQDQLVCVFPEGVAGISKEFSERYKLQKFGKGGFIKLSLETGAPIIPCAVIGAEEIHPIIWKSEKWGKAFGLPFFPITVTFPWLGPLGLIPFPTKWTIYFGKPIHFKEPAKARFDKKTVDHLTLKVKEQVQHMIDIGLKKRKSVWE